MLKETIIGIARVIVRRSGEGVVRQGVVKGDPVDHGGIRVLVEVDQVCVVSRAADAGGRI